MACKYFLNVKGNKYTFNSEEELDKFIRVNYNTLKYYNKYGDVVFDESNKIQASVYNKLLTSDVQVRESSFNGITQENEVNTSTAKGVTKAITEWLSPQGKLLLPEFRLEEYKKSQLEILINKGISEEEAADRIETEVKNWEHLARMGDKLHKVAELFFKDQDLDIISQAVNLPYDVVENLYSNFKSLKENISRGKNYKFIPEITLQTTDTQSDPIIGRIDLLAIDENGNIEIYDFKVSTKPYSDWYSAKKLTTDYQLAAYRGLLANNGISVRNASLHIVPVIIGDLDYENNIFKSYVFGDIVNRSIDTASASKLAYPNGFISKMVQQHIRPQVNEVSSNSDFIKNVSIYSELAFGRISKETPQEFVNRYAKYDKVNKIWYFNDYISQKKNKEELPIVEADSKEALIEKAAQYLNSRDNSKESYYYSLWKNFDFLKKQGKSFESSDRFKSTNQRVNSYLTRLFCTYIDNPGYEVLDMPELAQMGIYAFLDKANGIVDFITLTNLDLLKPLNFNNKSDNIFGNLGNPSKFSNISNLMQKNIGSAKLLQTMLAINELPDVFQNFRIGNVQVVNYQNAQSFPVDISKLAHNFNVLAQELNIENNIKNKIPIADRIEALRLKTLNILSSDRTELGTKAYDSVMDFYTNYSLDNTTAEYKIEQLRKLQEIIKEAAGSRLIIKSDNNYDSDPTGLSLLYAQVSSTILHYKKIYFDTDHDIDQIKSNLTKIKDSLLVSGYYVENPEMVSNRLMKAIVDVTEDSFQLMREQFEKYKEKSLKRVLDLYKDKGMSQLKRWTYADASRAFDNMWVRDNSGRIAKEFKVKNPYDLSNNLSNEERKWLKEFLWNINRVKNGIDSRLTESKAIDTPEVQALINSSEYFDVPLLRGTAFSQMRYGGVFSWLKDKFNEQVDIRRATDEQVKTIEEDSEAGKNDYLTMYNFLNVSPTTREKYLAEQDTGYWETNLELLEDIFIHAHLRKTNFDNILPFINDIKNSLYLMSYNTNIDFNRLKDQVDLYIKTVIFNESGIETANRQVMYKIIKPLMDFSRVVMLGWNMNSIFREPVQGAYMLMSRAGNRVLGDNSFTMKDAAKAWGIVMANTGYSSDSWTLIEALNHFYGLTMMDANGFAYMLNSDRKGFKGLTKRSAYWATTAPDFLNRMTFLVAQMIHDGCYEAHSMVNGELKYDWRKDKRYSVFARGDKTNPLYNQQMSDYIAHLSQFNQENANNPEWKELKFNATNPEALPAAYTIAEKRNIKSSADSLFGYMDHENMFAARHKLVGKLFTQFKTYFSSTRERWTLGGTDQTPKGEWRHKRDDMGNLLYLKPFVNVNGELEVMETTEVTDIPAQEWSGRFIEGMINSTIYYFRYLWNYALKHNHEYEIEHLQYRKRNARMMFNDLLWKALLFMLFKLLMDDSDGQEQINPFLKNIAKQSLINSTDELEPLAIITNLIQTPPTLSMLDRVRKSIDLLASGDSSFGKELKKNVYFIKQFDVALDALSDKEE